MPHPRVVGSRMVPVKKKGSWFYEMSWITKLLLLGLCIGIGVLIYWQISQAIRKYSDHRIHTQIQSGHLDYCNIHILIYAHRCNPHILSQTIFSAFEAAHFPETVHVHMFQEMCVEDDPNFEHGDAYTCYVNQHSQNHTNKQSWESHIHVLNENVIQATGFMVSHLTLLQESVLNTFSNPDDKIIIVQPFYDIPGGINIFPITFAQEYDDILRNADIVQNIFYSGHLPRTSQSATNATQFTQLTSSVSHAIGSHILIPMFKRKQHSRYLESQVPHTCTAKACRNLTLDQAGFTMFTTIDRTSGVPIRQQSDSDIPFTIHRMFRDHYFPVYKYQNRDTAHIEWDKLLKDPSIQSQISNPVPIVGIHDDFVCATLGTFEQMVEYGHSLGRPYVQPGPFYIQTLTFSNLCFNVGEIRSSNHLHIGAIFDHLQGAGAMVDPKTLQHTQSFVPENWNVKTSESGKQIIVDDPSEVVQISEDFNRYSGASTDNVTELGYLGITTQDTPHSYQIKYRSLDEYERQVRMLKGIRSTA